MSVTQKSVNDVIAFLDHLENKSIIPRNTAVGRRVAAKKFFDGLDPEEQTVGFVNDNFEVLYERFKNKNALAFKGNSLEVYRSRVKNLLEDFFQWSDDPAAWERSLNSKKSSAKTNGATSKQSVKAKTTPKSTEANPETTGEPSVESKSKMRKLSFPISPGVEVTVEFPADGLTVAGLSKLGMFLFPYCKDISNERWENVRWPMIGPKDGGGH